MAEKLPGLSVRTLPLSLAHGKRMKQGVLLIRTKITLMKSDSYLNRYGIQIYFRIACLFLINL
jgi:hypothetical protein